MSKKFLLFERSLRLYPKAYREKYGSQIVQTLSDMLDDQPTKAARAKVWARAGMDLTLNLVLQNANSIGDTFMNGTPTYVKRSGLISGILLSPFLLAILANSITTLLFSHNLYKSWAWSPAVLVTWVLILPSLACVIALLAYANFVIHNDKQPILKRMFNVRQIWPIVVAGLFGFGILFVLVFHDSAHCWTQSPVNSITQWNQTWQCTNNSMLGGK